jgi:hypothetical protein
MCSAERIIAIILTFVLLISVVMGWVLASGFEKVFAIILPPYSLYLTVEHFMTHFNLL